MFLTMQKDLLLKDQSGWFAVLSDSSPVGTCLDMAGLKMDYLGGL